MQEIISAAKDFGVPITMVAVFIWWGFKREKRLSDKLDEVQKERINELVEVVRSNTKAFNANTAAFNMLKLTLEKLNDRPCMMTDDHK